MTKRMFSWLVAIVAMMLLVPSACMAYEVGDEFELSFDGNSTQNGVVENAVTVTFTVIDPANHKVAIWKRYNTSVKVSEDNIIQANPYSNTGKSAVWVNSSANAFSLPDEVTAPDGEVYTISAIGPNAFNNLGYYTVITRLPQKLELVGSYGVKNIYNIDFSQMPLLRIVGPRGMGLYCYSYYRDGVKHIDMGTIETEYMAMEEVYSQFLYWVMDNSLIELDLSKMPKLKKIHAGAFSSLAWKISKRSFHIPAHIKWIETSAFSTLLTYPVTDVYFEHTSANSIEWKVYDDGYNNSYACADFVPISVNIHVCDELLQQCKDGTRTDDFANYYRQAPSTIDPEANWQTGRSFFATTPIGSGTMDLQYTITDYDNREVYVYHPYYLGQYGSTRAEFFYKSFDETTADGYKVTEWQDGFNGTVRYNYGTESSRAFSNFTVSEASDLTIPQTVKCRDGETYTVVGVGGGAFAYCPFLKTVTLPATVRSISAKAFNKSSIKTLNLNQLSNLCHVGFGAFEESALTGHIELADGVTELYGYTFYKSAVTSFKSNKIKRLENAEFIECLQLATVTFDASLETIGAVASNYDKLLQNEDADATTGANTRTGYTFSGCTNLTTVNFSDAGNLTYIGPGAFGKTGLSGDFVIPEGVRYICGGGNGYGAFGETKITSVVFPSTLLFDAGSFYNCTTLKSADLTKCTKARMMDCTFTGCESLTKVDMLPRYKHLKSMNSAFNGCVSMTGELVIPEGVEIGTFYNLAVSKITYPKSIKKISAGSSPNLTTVNFGELENLNDASNFDDCNLQGEISFCSKVTGVGSFVNNPGITKVTYPAGMQYFNGSAFVRCPGITDVYIKRYDSEARSLSIKNDDYYKVMNNPTGTKLHVSQRIIDECKAGVNNGFLEWYNANPDCLVPYDEASLPTGASIKVPMPLVNDDGEENGQTANVLFTITDSDKREIGLFTNTNGYYNYDDDGYGTLSYPENYIGDDNFLFNSNGKNDGGGWCVRDMTGEGYLILPETLDLKDGHTYTLTMIGSRAVQGRYNYNYINYQSVTCDKLLGILIPKTVRRIGDYAFAGNNKLGMVLFDDDSQLEHIGKHAFQSLDYPVVDFTTLPKLKIIDDGAFSYTEGYGETLNLGNTVEVIGAEAFYYSKLKGTIELPASLKRLGAKAFGENKNVSRVNFNNLKPWALTWEGSGDKSENFAATTVVGCSQGIIDQCAEGTRQDQFMAYYPNQLVSIGNYVVIDLTGDGMTDGKDVMMLMDIISGKEPMSAAADLTGDGKVDIADIILLLKKMME